MKGLKALKRIKDCLFWSDDGLKDISIIEKELKALEIIKNRQVEMWDFMQFMLDDDYDFYAAWCEGEGYIEDFIMTKEEFVLLQEVLSK